jgi:hypothetical protein
VANVENLQLSVANYSYNKAYTTVQAEFDKLFSKAENVTWYNLKKDYGANFTIDDIGYRVLFNRKGKLIYKITYGKEKQLPVLIRKMVKSNYVEHLITAASLVEENDRKIWVINLEDESRYVIVGIENNQISENMKFKKQK